MEDDAAYVEAELIRSHGMLPEPLGVIGPLKTTPISQFDAKLNSHTSTTLKLYGRFQPGKCLGCVNKVHFYKLCPHKNDRCVNCRRLGHTSRVCPSVPLRIVKAESAP